MANTTNMKIDRNEVPEDILRIVKLDEFEAATCTPIKATAKIGKALKAMGNKVVEYLNNEDFLTGVRVGMYTMLICINIGVIAKNYKEKKNSK